MPRTSPSMLTPSAGAHAAARSLPGSRSCAYTTASGSGTGRLGAENSGTRSISSCGGEPASPGSATGCGGESHGARQRRTARAPADRHRRRSAGSGRTDRAPRRGRRAAAGAGPQRLGSASREFEVAQARRRPWRDVDAAAIGSARRARARVGARKHLDLQARRSASVARGDVPEAQRRARAWRATRSSTARVAHAITSPMSKRRVCTGAPVGDVDVGIDQHHAQRVGGRGRQARPQPIPERQVVGQRQRDRR